MQTLGSTRVPASQLRRRMQQLGAQFYPGRSNPLRHIYYSRRLGRWLAVSGDGEGYLRVNQYAECPCGAIR